MDKPLLVILMSGKRKSGKDYIAERLLKSLGTKCQVLRISEPIKSHYAKENGLNLDQLMSEKAYKETYRLEMIRWSDAVRAKEPGYFCKVTCSKALEKDIWLVSDIRRRTDIEWFKATYGDKVKLVRIIADIGTRGERGWQFTTGVDDVSSECDLDEFADWDLVISNNSAAECERGIEQILCLIQQPD